MIGTPFASGLFFHIWTIICPLLGMFGVVLRECFTKFVARLVLSVVCFICLPSVIGLLLISILEVFVLCMAPTLSQCWTDGRFFRWLMNPTESSFSAIWLLDALTCPDSGFYFLVVLYYFFTPNSLVVRFNGCWCFC